MAEPENDTATEITGRCYCGATTLDVTQPPRTVAYCHCTDCRRVTGAPVAAFAAFDETAVTFTPNEGRQVNANPGVVRTSCPVCGSPLTGRYEYLPGQVYIPVGLLDQADTLAPQLHAHASKRLSWLRIDDDLECFATSARSQLVPAED